MVEEGTLCVNADVLKKAGVKASSTSTAEAYTNFYIKIVEGQVCLAAKYDFVSEYANLSSIGKEILRDAVSSGAAVLASNYDTDSFVDSQAFLTLTNILWASYQRVLNLLEKEDDYKEFIITGEGAV